MRISVFGLGYVGAVTSVCLCQKGHQVIGVDIDRRKVDLLNAGRPPISEPKLRELLLSALEDESLDATTDFNVAVEKTDVAIVCVGTPSLRTGGLDDTFLARTIRQIAGCLRRSPNTDEPFVVIVRSTCLPSTHQMLMQLLTDESGRELGETVGYVCHPEFLREGSAVDDFFNPPKIVFGAEESMSIDYCRQLYDGVAAPEFVVPVDIAAMVKYADNCFHAAKVTFANEIGTICHEQDVNAVEVMKIFCEDTKLNISPRYLRPGSPYGGSCLPKDLRAVLDLGRRGAVNTPMLAAIWDSNRNQIEAIVDRVLDHGARRVGIVGLAFKENTDDLRESPSLAVVERLFGKGLDIRIFDEYLSVQEIYGTNREHALKGVPHLESLMVDDLQELVDNTKLILVFHRIDEGVQSGLCFSEDHHVFDLSNSFHKAGVSCEGIYW
jgi:GDP-mannose 6-dehydrogenase